MDEVTGRLVLGGELITDMDDRTRRATTGREERRFDDGETGLLFEAGNAADLAEKMRFLLDRPELCREWGRNGQRKLRKEFSRESHYGRLMEIYGSVLNADKTPERVLAQAG